MMLSEIGRFALIDDTEWRARLVDLCIDPSAGDYPPVTHVIYRTPSQEQRGQEQRALPWDAVKAIDETARQMRVADLASGEQAPRESLKQAVLLSRDILDALILDLENRRAARANDLWLEHQDNRLYLSAADTSLSAILRRLSRGRLAHGRDRGLYDWKYVEFLRGDPHVLHAGAQYHSRIWRLPPGQIARMTDALPYLHAAELLKLLPDRVASDTLEAMMPERQLQVLEELDEDARLRLLALMRPDIAADLIGRLDTELARRCLERLPDVQRERIIELLRYPGGYCRRDHEQRDRYRTGDPDRGASAPHASRQVPGAGFCALHLCGR